MSKSDISLGVNIDHVATVRQARGTRYPEPVDAALMAERAGADSITVHLREDRRHIQDRDVQLLADVLQTHMNLEMAMTPEMIKIAVGLGPTDCCLVPERREEVTTEGGLDVAGQIGKVREACGVLLEAGIRVSLFVDPELQQVEAAAEAGAPVVELHTGCYADAEDRQSRQSELKRIVECARRGHDAGLIVHGGHGLNYHNVGRIAEIPQMRELNIGHAIVARAVMEGLPSAVAKMKQLMLRARKH